MPPITRPAGGEVAALLLSLIPDGAVAGVGDSHTIYALDLDEKLAAKGCQAIPSMAALTGTSYDCNPPAITGPHPGGGPADFGRLPHGGCLPPGGPTPSP